MVYFWGAGAPSHSRAVVAHCIVAVGVSVPVHCILSLCSRTPGARATATHASPVRPPCAGPVPGLLAGSWSWAAGWLGGHLRRCRCGPAACGFPASQPKRNPPIQPENNGKNRLKYSEATRTQARTQTLTQTTHE